MTDSRADLSGIFIDQALWVEDEVTGRRVLRYGGDFDDVHRTMRFPEMGSYLRTGQ